MLLLLFGWELGQKSKQRSIDAGFIISCLSPHLHGTIRSPFPSLSPKRFRLCRGIAAALSLGERSPRVPSRARERKVIPIPFPFPCKVDLLCS